MNVLFIFGSEYLWILSPLAALWYFWKLPREMRGKFLTFASVILPIAFLLGLFAKALWTNPTPLYPEENGFPSDHTLLVAALAALLMFFNKKLSLWLWIIAGVVAISRVYAGEHHTIDVVGSIGIALLSLGIAYVIMRRIWKRPQANS